ncbi:fatty acid desaturase family protein [Ferruginibacter profundus]
MTDNYPIPEKTNLAIIAICSAVYFFLLLTGAHIHTIGFKLLLAVAFAIMMIPVYSLMHEAAHNALHPNPRWNVLLGRWLCCLFIVSFHFFRHCHLKHHKKNRTDEEMWDLYYEHQNKWLRYGNLYLMMVGFGYLALWLSVILFAIAPGLVNSALFKKHKEIRGFLEGSDDVHKLRICQVESIVVIAFQVFCLWLINWDVETWLIFYLLHGFVWSSQNYINHAFSPRDIINGAHNLKIPVWLNLIYLNFNLHLAHHQNPKIPWLHLPKFIRSGKGRFSFFKNYLRLWKGPKLTKEESPKVISK